MRDYLLGMGLGLAVIGLSSHVYLWMRSWLFMLDKIFCSVL